MFISQVDEIKQNGEDEFRRRTKMERALRNAESFFKQELHEKDDMLHRLQNKIRRLKDGSLRPASAPAPDSFCNAQVIHRRGASVS